jgi:hypothetical protein
MFINPVEPASDLMVHHVVNAHQGLLSEEDILQTRATSSLQESLNLHEETFTLHI